MRVEGIRGSLWAHIEARDYNDPRYGKVKRVSERPLGSTGFERFGQQNIDLLKVVEEIFGVKAFDEFGLDLTETGG